MKTVRGGSLFCFVTAVGLAGCGAPSGAIQRGTENVAAVVAPTTTNRTCLAGRYSFRLQNVEATCPASSNPSWKVAKHRTARMEPITNAEQALRSVLTAATCTYRWVGGSPEEPLHLGDLPAGASLEPLCIDEPPPPDSLAADACSPDHQIGFRPTAMNSCPAASGWTVGQLFSDRAGDLGRYCVYDRVPEAPTAEALPTWVKPDCNVVGVQAGATDRAAMEQAFFDGVEGATTLPFLVGGANPAPVGVTVVDSAFDRRDDGLPGAGRAAHGHAMAAIIRSFACPPAPSACVVDVRNRLALWLERTPAGIRRNPKGGFFGSQADLARAIVDAVDFATPGQPSIVNLSLGWTKFFGGTETSPNAFAPQVRAVYHALEYARCRNTLVIAAAGNAKGRPPLPIGPLYPAAWTERLAPTPTRCAELGVPITLSTAIPPPQPRPLLFSTGGLDFADQRLFNTPIGGRPPLAAVALQAVVPDPAAQPVQAGGAYSGSSVAAAVTSAAAALVWAYQPTLTPDRVIDKIYGAGVDLQVPADFCIGGAGCPNIRRLSICASAHEACGTGGICATPPACTPGGLLRSPPSEGSDHWLAHAGACATPSTGNVCLPTASTAPVAVDAWGLPFAGPQPGEPICTTCGFSYGSWSVDFGTNLDLWHNYYRTQGVYLWDMLGGLWLDTSWNTALWFHGGDHPTSLIDLTWVAPPIYWAEADFIYPELSLWGAYYTQTEPLILQ